MNPFTSLQESEQFKLSVRELGKALTCTTQFQHPCLPRPTAQYLFEVLNGTYPGLKNVLTDTYRINWIIKVPDIVPLAFNSVGINETFERAHIDVIINRYEEAEKRSLTERRHKLLEERRRIDAELLKLQEPL